MKWKIKAKEIQKSFYSIQSICNKKTVSEVTSMAEMSFEKENLIIRATDFETYMQITIKTQLVRSEKEKQIKNTENQSFSVNARRIYEITKDLIEEEDVCFEILETNINITTNNLDISLAISRQNLEIFYPTSIRLEPIKIENFGYMKSIALSNAIGYCTNVGIGQLTGGNQVGNIQLIFSTCGELKISSTDGHSLAHIALQSEEIKPSENLTFVISKKAASDIKKIIENYEKNSEVIIGKMGNNLTISGQNFTTITKTFSEPFPAYEKILTSKEEAIFECNKNEIQKSVKRISCLTAGKFIPAFFEFENETLQIKINHNEVGSAKEKIVIENKNKNERKFFNAFPPYILQAIGSLPENSEGKITIACSGEKKPIFFKFKNETTKMIFAVMPMVNQKEV